MERYRSKLNPFQALAARIEELERLTRIILTRDRSFPGWIEPTLLNNWANFGGSEDTAGYWRNPGGLVVLKGAIKDGVIPSSAFVLPEGLRPLSTKRFPIVSNNLFGVVYVNDLGVVTVISGDNIRVDLSSIIFRAEQ